MPFISAVTSMKLDETKKNELKSELGNLITILPGKSEGSLMIDIQDGHNMYFRGQAADCAFMEIRLFKASPMDEKKQLTEEIFKMMDKLLGIKNDQMFLNIIEFENWGSGGVYK